MKPTLTVYRVEGRTWHELKAPGIQYIFEDNENGRRVLNKIIKRFK